MDKLKEFLRLLEERLVEHDISREEIQRKLGEVCAMINDGADLLEEKINGEISKDLEEKEEKIIALVDKFIGGESKVSVLVKQAKKILSKEWGYEIQRSDSAESFIESYVLLISSVNTKEELHLGGPNKIERITTQLHEHLAKLHDLVVPVRAELAEICGGKRREAEELERRVNGELEMLFTQEDERLQSVVKELKENLDGGSPEEVEELVRKAKSALFRSQRYSLEKGDSFDRFDLRVIREASLKYVDFEERKPANLVPSFTENGKLSLSFAFFDADEVEFLKGLKLGAKAKVKVWEKGNEKATSKMFTCKYTLGSDEPVCIGGTFTAGTTYCLKTRTVHQGMSTPWSDEAEFTPEFKCCTWKECPDDVDERRKYSVDKENPRIARKIGDGYNCTIIGNTPLPLNTVTSWNIKVLKSKWNDGDGIYIGVAPSDINQNEYNLGECGWYFGCWSSTLYSGPPHNCSNKEYGPRKEWRGRYVHIGDSIGVVMDTTNDDLSFALNGKNLGVAFGGIPLDKPLVPCVLLYNEGDSVELVIYDVDSSIPVPSNIASKSGITWDSITFVWNAVEGASFYQIEVDECKFWDSSTTNSFTKRGLLPDTEHTFRVRAVRGNSVSEWSDAVKGRAQKAPEFEECCIWKECPGNVDEDRKYSVDEENQRIATKINNDGSCTVIGSAPLPINKVT